MTPSATTRPARSGGRFPQQCLPELAQSIDVNRPHTLLTKDTKSSGMLVYLYDDTGVQVTVPNCPSNQPYWVRSAYLREWLAANSDRRAERMRNNPPFGTTLEEAKLLAKKLRDYADKIRSEADRLDRAGRPSHPVAASSMPLFIGSPPA